MGIQEYKNNQINTSRFSNYLIVSSFSMQTFVLLKNSKGFTWCGAFTDTMDVINRLKWVDAELSPTYFTPKSEGNANN
ncbi:MAG: hypothetical protein WCG93_06465 [Paludibacter sp.]